MRRLKKSIIRFFRRKKDKCNKNMCRICRISEYESDITYLCSLCALRCLLSSVLVGNKSGIRYEKFKKINDMFFDELKDHYQAILVDRFER